MIGPAVRTVDVTAADQELSTGRLNFMRCGYAFMGVLPGHHHRRRHPLAIRVEALRPDTRGFLAMTSAPGHHCEIGQIAGAGVYADGYTGTARILRKTQRREQHVHQTVLRGRRHHDRAMTVAK